MFLFKNNALKCDVKSVILQNLVKKKNQFMHLCMIIT